MEAREAVVPGQESGRSPPAALAEALYETLLACVLLLKPLDTRRGLSLPAGTNAQIP